MAQPRTARGSCLGFAEDDTTYGTAASSPSGFVRLFTGGIVYSMNYVPIGTLADSNNASEVVSTHIVTEATNGGTVEMPLLAEGLGLLYKHALWGTPSTGGSGPYVHTYTIGSSRPSLGLTFEQSDGTKADTSPGMRIGKMTVKGEVKGGVFRLALDVMGQAPTTERGSPTSPTYTTNEAASTLEWWRGNSASINSNSYKLQAFELTVDRKLEALNSLAQLVTEDPATSDRPEVKVKLRLAMYDDQLYTDFIAGTSANLTFTLAKGTKSIAFTVHNALITSYAENRGTGPTMIDIEATAQSSSGSSGLAMVVTNSQSSATAV